MSDHEEEFYYQEVAVDYMSSPPTMSHRDMARPPHEDPEYQKQLRLESVVPLSGAVENSSSIVSGTATTIINTNNKERIFNFGHSTSLSPVFYFFMHLPIFQ